MSLIKSEAQKVRDSILSGWNFPRGNDVSPTSKQLLCCAPHHFLRLAEAAWRKQTLEIAGPELESWLCHHSPAL